MGFIDLHVHSTASDGSLTPAQLVQYACEKGLYAFALTDHDTVAGIGPAIAAARKFPVRIIPGVEISCAIGGRIIHLLGYHIDYENPAFIRALRILSYYRDERNLKMCSQMRAYGIPIDYEEFRGQLGCRMVTRMHFAEYMVAGGHVADISEAFERYLAKGQPCYIPMHMLPARDAVRLITRAKGKAVLAHPVKYRLSEKGYLQLLTLLKDFGLRGVEAIYPDQSHEDEMKFTALAGQLGLFITGGSDFHGALNPSSDLGTGRGNLMIPQSFLDNIM